MKVIMQLSEALSDAEIFTDGDWVESKDQDPSGGVRLTQLADVGDGNWVNKSDRYLTFEKSKKLRCTYLREGDLLIARMPDPLGRCCIFPGDKLPCVTVVDVCIVRPNKQRIDNRYLMHVINSPVGRRGIAKHITGTTRQRISRKNLGKIEIPLPPLGEQKRIAAILDAADDLRAKRRETLAQLDTLLQSTFLDMFGDPVTNPKGWRVSTLGQECVEIKNGRSIKQSQNAGGIPISRIETISDGVVNPDKVGYAGLELGDAEKDILRPGDILFSHINSTKHLCKCAIYQKDHGILVHGMNLLRFRTGKDLNPLFLLYLLKNEKYRPRPQNLWVAL